jgi:hypothetical protein
MNRFSAKRIWFLFFFRKKRKEKIVRVGLWQEKKVISRKSDLTGKILSNKIFNTGIKIDG